jgi:XTP/dITP diphosphohydrolase
VLTDRLLLATRSPDKVREIRQILRSVFSGGIITLDDAGIAAADDEEHLERFASFLENAHAKAAFFMEASGMPTLADDSGIEVDALDGRPGVRSKRYAGAASDVDAANNRYLLGELRGVPAEARTARYVCAAVLHLPDRRRVAAVGTCEGRILEEPRGSGGFGYDPLFFDPTTGLTFGETDPAAKNRKSHRARALRGLAANLPRLE